MTPLQGIIRLMEVDGLGISARRIRKKTMEKYQLLRMFVESELISSAVFIDNHLPLGRCHIDYKLNRVCADIEAAWNSAENQEALAVFYSMPDEVESIVQELIDFYGVTKSAAKCSLGRDAIVGASEGRSVAKKSADLIKIGYIKMSNERFESGN